MRFPLALLLATALVSVAPFVEAAEQTPAQKQCILALSGAATHVARAVSANVVECVDEAVKGERPAGRSAAECVAADAAGRLTDAVAATAAAESAYCSQTPEFGPTSAVSVNTEFSSLPTSTTIFGDDLDAALAAGITNRAVRACQVGIAQRAHARIRIALRRFRRCAKDGLGSEAITQATDLAECYGTPLPERLSTRMAHSAAHLAALCASVDLGSAAPGACADQPAPTLAACIDQVVDCDAWAGVEAAYSIDPLRPHRFVDGVATRYCGARPPPTTQSVARQWDEEILDAIRIDFPRPPIHARNLFHVSAATWDAWAAYDPTADGYFVSEKPTSADIEKDRETAISFAAYRVLASRYAISPNAKKSSLAFRRRMNQLGYDYRFVDTDGDSAAALGNRIGAAAIAYGLDDGSMEALNYRDDGYHPQNDPLIVKLPGTEMRDPNRWQPLALDHQIGQNGIPIPGMVQTFVGSQWGSVLSFAIDLTSLLPLPPPRLHDPLTDSDFKEQALEVVRFSSRLTPDDPALIDISPGAYGNNSLGANDGTGHPVNPVTGVAYAPELVKRGDFGRVMAEFWADGPTSETPPGHWNTIANYVVDHPLFERRFEGTGPLVDPLEWDVKMYLALNGAVHDAAVGAWGTKRVYDSVRPISMIRYMGGLGQSSDPLGPSYDPDGLPLEPGVVEVITPESSASGERHEALADFVGEIAVLSWPGEPADPTSEYSGTRWIRAKEWVAYQRSTFVTPPFAAYVSGHSTFSRAAAEVLTRMTGSPYFPGGLGEFVAPKDDYLVFEDGPSETVALQWATYYDAADEAGQSRLWGGIHIRADDFEGRIMGSTIGNEAFDKALTYFDGSANP